MRTSRLLRSRLRRKVIVTLRSGDSFGGVLWEADSHAFVVREAVLYGAGANRTPLGVDGEVLLLAEDVLYVQLP